MLSVCTGDYLRSKSWDNQVFHLDSYRQEQKRSDDLLLMSWYKFFLPQKKIKCILSINLHSSRNKQWKTILTKPSSKSKTCVYRVKLLLSFLQLQKDHLTPIIISHSTWSPLAQSMEHLNKSQRNLDMFLILPFRYFFHLNICFPMLTYELITCRTKTTRAFMEQHVYVGSTGFSDTF